MLKADLEVAARLSVAPMMDWTDRHCRYFHRRLSRRALLYTEMVTAPALVRGGALHLLDHSSEEHPVALQLGGSDPVELADAAQMGAAHGYDEINLNVGCPSDRVQSGAFGAVLMRDPGLVARCVEAMRDRVEVPVTVKCRIGVDDQEPTETLPNFLEHISGAGCERVIIHARKAWLNGLSPKENRTVPPLNYPLVFAMKERFPDLYVSLNGGLETLAEAQRYLTHVDGIMIGRAAYHHPNSVLGPVDRLLFGDGQDTDPVEVATDMLSYIADHLDSDGKVHDVTRHMLGLFSGRPGARQWRRDLSGLRPDATVDQIEDAIERVRLAQSSRQQPERMGDRSGADHATPERTE